MMASSYLDTSFVLKFYLMEPESAAAVEWLRMHAGSGCVSRLSDLEVITSLERNPSSEEARQNIAAYRQDMADGIYRRLEIDAAVYTRAEEIAEGFARRYKLRSLDILHLATALRHGIVSFGTYDKRLAAAAGAMGLEVFTAGS